jgi:cysteine sulfinate desulfinase/cysteine desulfurase-like protein
MSFAADEEDSYTKEETKTPKFVNLVHAASIQKQASMVLQTQQSAPLNGGTPRSQSGQGQSAAVSPEAERSVPTSNIVPEPLSDQQVRVIRLNMQQSLLSEGKACLPGVVQRKHLLVDMPHSDGASILAWPSTAK